ncbi:MAG TPA: gliding motility-associated C-terminal domain-containing protein [Cyclobacteriaceae bacterium]|nr:gliding motility-associated C-terminal domain-containing protein [Cyclobacteriaceae bacterium]
MKSKYTCLVFLVGMSLQAYSQDIHNGASIFIPASIDAYFNSLYNSGFIQNNGTIEVTGDWKNTNVYQGLGAIVLSGKDQRIDNNDQAIEKLLIEGSGMKSVDGKLVINGSLDLASGVIKISENDTLLIRAGASIEGGSRSSFVDGKLTREGTGYRFFPVGRDGYYLPITLTDVTGVNPITEIAAFRNFPRVATSRNVNIDHSFYWTKQGMSPIMLERENFVFMVADDFDEEFEVIETDDEGVSKKATGKSIIAAGDLIREPVLPMYLSTTVSPNAQNPENRLVKLFGTEVTDENFSFRVFNRWGSLLFEATSASQMTTDGWDGKHGDQFLPSGAYPFKMNYVDVEGREGNKTGFITIIY